MKSRAVVRFIAFMPWVLVAAHCKELPYESSLAPRNSCSEHPCEAFRQEGTAVCDFVTRMCKLNSTLKFTILVSTPPGAAPYYAPLTAVMTSAELEKPEVSAPCPDKENGCVLVPQLARAQGWYSFDPAARVELESNLGNSGLYATIPQHTTWFQLVGEETVGDLDTPLATDFGLPISPIFSPMVVPLVLDPLVEPKPDPGPFQSAPIGWNLPLPTGRYLRVISPEPPLDQVFPPHEQAFDIVQSRLDPIAIDSPKLDALRFRKFTISPDPSQPRDLTGFTAVLQNSIRRRNISRSAVLAAGANEVTLATIGHPDLDGLPVELVIDPPFGVQGLPSLIGSAIPVLSHSQTYPALPPPANVTGKVTGPEGTAPVQATLMIRSVDEPGALTSVNPKNVLLRYARTIRTDSSGSFQVTLPPGRYDLAILPEAASLDAAPLALWVGKMDVKGDAPQTFPLVRQTEVRGSVVLADGSVVPEADVEAHAAVSPSKTGPFAKAMRTARTTTDATGAFSLQLDPGEYDIVVRPRVGTRFPWVVSTSHKIADVPVTLDRLVVPAPIVVSAILLTPGRSFAPPDDPLVRGALVRAFAVPKCPPGQSCGNRAVEIGQAVTDANGKLELFLTEPRNVSAKPPN